MPDPILDKTVSELEKPSQGVQGTNLDTCYFRSFSDIPNSKRISEIVGAERETAERREEEGFENQKPIIPFFEARYKAIDELIVRSKVKQVVEFAAGRTTRGINNPDWNYVHTDQQAESLSQMENTVRIISPESRKSPMHFIKLDAITGKGLDQVIKCLNEEPVAVVHEGLMTYYPIESKAKIAQNAKKLLERFGGVYITPDIHTKGYSAMIKLSPNYKERQQMRSKRAGRDLDSMRFNSTEQALAFFAGIGFKVKIYKLGELVPKLSCVDVLFEDAERRKLVTDTILNREVWCMTLTS